MIMKHVVVDGSNIATEGREAPSLAQLDEAVQAFLEEYSPEVVTVVVDATFPNRIAVSERAAYEDAVAANELITPPAGAIGRGDGFVLQIARRANATILSNDSFQEFHGMYPWLFERGRLIGGKPVPHVGWVFMERAPVRGPTSRRAVSEARKEARSEKASVSSPAAGTDEAIAPVGSPAKRSVRGGRTRKSAADDASAAPVSPNGSSEQLASSPDDDPVAIPVVAATAATEGPEDSAGARSGGRKARAAAIDKANGGIDPYNDPLPFIEFVGAHAVGSLVEATIERFSSHGAYAVVGDARGYIPLRYLGDPPPRSAKELLTLGEVRTLVVVAVDPPRRGIDLGLPEAVTVPSAAPTDDLDVEVLADTADVFHTYDVDDDAVAPEPAPAPAKRSRKRAAATPAPDEGADAVAEATPAKRSRKKAAAPAVEPAPAKRSRARRTAAAAEAPVEGAAPAVEPAPAKRSRRKAAATPAPVPADTTAEPADTTGPDATAPEATTPAPAKRTRKRAAARSEPAAEGAVDDTAVPEASAPAPSPGPAKRTRRQSPDASPDTDPDAPSTGPAPAGVPEPAAEAEPAPAKRSRKRAAEAPTDATPDPAEAAEAAPAGRSRRRAAAAPSSEAVPYATPAPAPTGESEEAAEAAPARRSRKRASTASSEPATRTRKRSAGTGGEAGGDASEPAPAPAKRSRRRVAAASTGTTSGTTSDTGSEPADAQPAAPARKRTRRPTASGNGSQ